MTAAPRRSGRRRALGAAAGLLVVAFLVWGVARGFDTVRAYDWRLDPLWLAGGLVLLLAFYGLSAAGYAETVARLAPGGPHRRVVADVWARSLLGRYVPGNVLMVAGRVVMGSEAGVARRVTAAATVYEQALALAAAAVAGVAAVAVHGEVGGAAPVWLVALVPLIVVPLHPRLFAPMTAWALRRAGREPLGATLPLGALLAVAARYAAAAAAAGAGVWMVVRAAAPDAGDVVLVGGGFLLAFTVSMLAFVFPSGLGVREGAFAAVLAVNLPGEVAVAVAVGSRLVLTAVELAFVAGAAVAGRRARRAGG